MEVGTKIKIFVPTNKVNQLFWPDNPNTAFGLDWSAKINGEMKPMTKPHHEKAKRQVREEILGLVGLILD